VISPETRITGLPYGEEIMIVGRTMWTESTSVTERQTDRQTDRQNYDNYNTAQRITSRCKNGNFRRPHSHLMPHIQQGRKLDQKSGGSRRAVGARKSARRRSRRRRRRSRGRGIRGVSPSPADYVVWGSVVSSHSGAPA